MAYVSETEDPCLICLGPLDPTPTDPILSFSHGGETPHAMHKTCYKALRANGIHWCPMCRKALGSSSGK
ncbi:hypothetical protein HK104_002109, partial [Borealophlyctis nickersoniae]